MPKTRAENSVLFAKTKIVGGPFTLVMVIIMVKMIIMLIILLLLFSNNATH